MFEQLQFSGLVLCFGPLALIIFGFIAFAALTDKNARRTYLRNLDPRPESERLGEPVSAVAGPLVTETPSGIRVKIEPPVIEPDDLQRIEGIGPKISSVLQEAGIMTFSQLAQTPADRVREILSESGISGAAGIHDPATWSEQARLAAKGDWETLQALQDELRGGLDT